jgi:hypothetical protein
MCRILQIGFSRFEISIRPRQLTIRRFHSKPTVSWVDGKVPSQNSQETGMVPFVASEYESPQRW